MCCLLLDLAVFRHYFSLGDSNLDDGHVSTDILSAILEFVVIGNNPLIPHDVAMIDYSASSGHPLLPQIPI